MGGRVLTRQSLRSSFCLLPHACHMAFRHLEYCILSCGLLCPTEESLRVFLPQPDMRVSGTRRILPWASRCRSHCACGQCHSLPLPPLCAAAIWLALLCACVPARAALAPEELGALISLYKATNGPQWAYPWNLAEDPCGGYWSGVQCDQFGSSVMCVAAAALDVFVCVFVCVCVSECCVQRAES